MEMNNPNQPVNQYVTPAPEHPVENQRNNLLIIASVLVLLLIVGGGAYYLGARSGKTVPQAQNTNIEPTAIPQNDTIPNPTDLPISTQSPQDDETANWKTYSSSVLSFKYPTTLTLEERQKNYMVLLFDANNPQNVLLSIDARQSGNYANYDNAITTTKAGLTNVQTQDLPNGVKISGEVSPGYGEGRAITIVIFKYGTAAVEVETSTTNQNQLETFNKIISTFTFTQ